MFLISRSLTFALEETQSQLLRWIFPIIKAKLNQNYSAFRIGKIHLNDRVELDQIKQGDVAQW